MRCPGNPGQTADVRYYKRRWEQGRGDQFDAWGPADYYFEVDDGGAVLRQIEVYSHGAVLRYDPGHVKDEFGQLADQPLDLVAMEPYVTDKAAFERAWPPGQAAGPSLG